MFPFVNFTYHPENSLHCGFKTQWHDFRILLLTTLNFALKQYGNIMCQSHLHIAMYFFQIKVIFSWGKIVLIFIPFLSPLYPSPPQKTQKNKKYCSKKTLNMSGSEATSGISCVKNKLISYQNCFLYFTLKCKYGLKFLICMAFLPVQKVHYFQVWL